MPNLACQNARVPDQKGTSKQSFAFPDVVIFVRTSCFGSFRVGSALVPCRGDGRALRFAAGLLKGS